MVTPKYRVACDAPETEDELIQCLQHNWEEITKVENLRPYIAILESQYRECIEKWLKSFLLDCMNLLLLIYETLYKTIRLS